MASARPIRRHQTKTVDRFPTITTGSAPLSRLHIVFVPRSQQPNKSPARAAAVHRQVGRKSKSCESNKVLDFETKRQRWIGCLQPDVQTATCRSVERLEWSSENKRLLNTAPPPTSLLNTASLTHCTTRPSRNVAHGRVCNRITCRRTHKSAASAAGRGQIRISTYCELCIPSWDGICCVCSRTSGKVVGKVPPRRD